MEIPSIQIDPQGVCEIEFNASEGINNSDEQIITQIS
jgi:hypothetical protein